VSGESKKMRNMRKNWLWFVPRVFGILFILFVSMFALDIFGQGYDFWQTVLGLTMHLLPSFFLAAALIVAWRWGRIGSLFYLSFAVAYLIMSWGSFHWSVYLIIAGVPMVIGILFYFDGLFSSRAKKVE
jgi:hypothetical protein